MTTILTAPEAIIHLVKCKCVKERCTSKRCQCSKANMNCMDLCGFSDMGERCEKIPRDDSGDNWSGWNPCCCMERIRLWAFPSSGGYLQLVTRTRLLSNATEASHCGPSSKASTSKVCRKWLETHLTDLSDSQSTWRIFCRIFDYQCV